ncbi:hypothetical protein [Peribacillus alkalitolerans]|uniref:hypothetical protein n=1 Tax=Peribacillus alkalitolerans TaxID=1550385 RepID=UPI0013D2101E|nr:hypothetical protein [Peribacillus alkalitolerans]
MKKRALKWAVACLFFLVCINLLGFVSIKLVNENTSEENRYIKIKNVTIVIQNDGNYDDALLDEIEKYIKTATEDVLGAMKSSIAPKEKATIVLNSSKAVQYVPPSYVSMYLYDPDQMYLEDWNFHEMMIYSLYPKIKMRPFTTIGLGNYLHYLPNEGIQYTAHDMWIIHKKHFKTPEFNELMTKDWFFYAIIRGNEDREIYTKNQASYWKIASFSLYLIEHYGPKKYLQLFNHHTAELNMEAVYGKTLHNLQKEWDRYTIEIETTWPKKYENDLEMHIQNLYE